MTALRAIVLTFSLISCSSPANEKNSSKEKEITIQDPFKIDSTLHAEMQQKESGNNRKEYKRDPLWELDNIDIKTGVAEIDSIILSFREKTDISDTVKKDFGWGDCGGMSRKIIDNQTNSLVYLFKRDCGEYGFGNDQFYFENNTLSIVRNFNYSIAQFYTDSTPTLHLTEEKLYFFKGDKVTVKKRETISSQNRNYDLSNIKFTETILDKNKTLKEKTAEYNQLVELEKSTN